MLSITYISTALKKLSNDELVTLLATWRSCNLRFDITGLLLYKAGSFIQTIEGPEASILRLYDNIKHDPLHTNVVTVLQESIQERHFIHWSMGFQLVDKLPKDIGPGFNALLSDPQMAETFAQ